MSNFVFNPAPVSLPAHRLDALGRHLWCHRRLFPHLVEAADEALVLAGGQPFDLASELVEPELGLEWAHYPKQSTPPIGPRYRLTDLGASELKNGDLLNPDWWDRFVVVWPRYQWGVLVALFATGCFSSTGDICIPRVRRGLLAPHFGWDAVGRLVSTRQLGRDVTDLVRSLTVLDVIPATSPDRAGAVVRLLDDIEKLCAQGLVHKRAPHPPKLVNPEFYEMHPDHQNVVRAFMRDEELAEDFSSDVQPFLRWTSERRVARKLNVFRGIPGPGPGLAELVTLGRVQMVIAQLLRGHPDRFWATASKVSIRDLYEMSGEQRIGSIPALHSEEVPDGEVSAAGRRSWLLPDGCLWVAGDQPNEPSVLIEYEAGEGDLPMERHLHTGLLLSSRWHKPMWLLVVTTGRSRAATITSCEALMQSDELGMLKSQYPGADLGVRVVTYTEARGTSAVTCPAVWEGRIVS
jgi:hypothetical protein